MQSEIEQSVSGVPQKALQVAAREPLPIETSKVAVHLDYVDSQQSYHLVISNHTDEAPISIERSVSHLYTYWARMIDIIFGFLGMVILLLVLPVVSLLIYLDSPGPIFYSQERLGYRKRLFRMYKFRSMHPDSGRTGHLIWAKAHDSRVIRVGRFLRATHLDELPQVWNILRGDMSLIGPRPEMPAFSDKFEKVIPFYSSRFTVKPGLTGWTQVNHNYGNTVDDERIKLQYDLDYIKNRSCILDMKIIVRTIGEVVFGHGR